MADENLLDLSPRHLRLIDAIAEHGQLSIAAAMMGMTQPAASRMLLEIERRVGATLFERRPKGMRATPIGGVVARRANAVMLGLSETGREIEAFKSGKSGTVRIGAVTGAAVGFAVPAIEDLKAEAGTVDVRLDVTSSDVLVQGLLAGDYDFVLGRIPPGVDARLFHILSGRTEIVHFVVRRDHALAARQDLSLSDLVGQSWVMQAAGSPLRQAVDDAFIARDLPVPADVVNSTSIVVTLAFVAASDTIGPVSREVADLLGTSAINANLTSLDLRETIIIAPYHLISRKEQMTSPVADRLGELVLNRLMAASARRGMTGPRA